MSETAKKTGGNTTSLPKVNNNNKSAAAAGAGAAASGADKSKNDGKKAASNKQGSTTETSLPKITPTKERPTSAGILGAANAAPSTEAPTQVVAAATATAEENAQTAAPDASQSSTEPKENITTMPPIEGAAPAEATAEAAPPQEVKAPVNINGNVTLLYEMYNEPFPIVEGSTTAANIDEVYCLSYVMPNCVIKLSIHPPAEKRRLEAEGSSLTNFFVFEEPRGTYQGLIADTSYYVYVEQEADQLKRDQERMKEIASKMEGGGKEAARAEGCSCIYGNPCIDQYICKDWGNRFAVATKNGWKGF